MTEAIDDGDLVARARKRVEEIKGFYVHLGVYLIVNAMLFTIDAITSPGTWWFYWPLLGWGVGVAIHAFGLLTETRLLGPEWEDKKVHEILEREGSRLGRSS